MRYNSKREKLLCRDSQFERYVVKTIKDFLSTTDEREAIIRQRAVARMPDKLRKAIKNPLRFVEQLTYDEKSVLLSKLGKTVIFLSLDELAVDELGRDGAKFKFTKHLRDSLKKTGLDNPFSGSFVSLPKKAVRYFSLVGAEQSNLDYIVNHDWKKIKSGVKTSQDKVDDKFKKLNEFLEFIVNYGHFARKAQKLSGITEYEFQILLYVAYSPELSIDKKRIAQKFTGDDKSGYTNNAIHALVRKRYLINEPIERKAQEKYLCTTEGWDLILSILDSILK